MASLESRLRSLIRSSPIDAPLPATRSLGQRFAVSYTTAFRTLRRLAEAGEAWQHPNGRFYPAAAQALLERPRPIACLTRRLELRSELYRELLEGVSAACGIARRTVLIWHDELLLNHPDPAEPPIFAGVRRQNAILDDFLGRHGGLADGVVLDHAWSDDALRSHARELDPGVVLYRRCGLEGWRNVHADFEAGALQALRHLLGRGFQRIVPIVPFRGDPAVAQFLAAVESAAARIGCGSRLAPRASAATARDRAGLLARIGREKRRTALVCPEDNVAMLLWEAARAAGLRCPDRFGLVAAMGTDFGRRSGISSVSYDFRAMGRAAVEALRARRPERRALPPVFAPGATT